jgi:hypothetical protein
MGAGPTGGVLTGGAPIGGRPDRRSAERRRAVAIGYTPAVAGPA